MRSLFVLIPLLLLLTTGCNPNLQVARVKPDRVVPIRPLPDEDPILADVYFSDDRTVELQIYQSEGREAPIYRAILINHRMTPLEFDLSKARRSVDEETDSAYGLAWYDGCELKSKKSKLCLNTKFTLKPGESKRITLQFGTVMAGQLSIPFRSDVDDSVGKVVARFEYCNPYWGKCETIR